MDSTTAIGITILLCVWYGLCTIVDVVSNKVRCTCTSKNNMYRLEDVSKRLKNLEERARANGVGV